MDHLFHPWIILNQRSRLIVLLHLFLIIFAIWDLVFEKRERVTEAKEIERDGVRDGRVVSEKTWEGARFRRTPFDSVVVFTTTTMVTSFSLSVSLSLFWLCFSLWAELVVVSRGDNTVVPRTGMSLVKICVGFTSSPPPQVNSLHLPLIFL